MLKTKNQSIITAEEIGKIDCYWRAANYLLVGQIYLLDNALLREPLTIEHVKPRLLGHWGTTPGLNFIYVHLNRLIKAHDLNINYIAGPGHGGPGIVANTYLEGTYSEVYPNISEDAAGMRKLFKQFSFPGGIPSHVAPETPGSIHEGGELGYALAHAYGAVFDNPDLIAACVIGDGEAETGALAASWHSNKFLNPARDGMVLPILHLNGYKIANPTVLARLSREELTSLMVGYGHKPYFVEGDNPELMHEKMASTLDAVYTEIKDIQNQARANGFTTRPIYPMIVLRTPKGWTGPKTVDGVQVEGTFRSHQVPLAELAAKPEHLKMLEEWMRSYKPEELFDENGKLIPELREIAPEGTRRMGMNPHANGGKLLKDLEMPNFCDYVVEVSKPAATLAEATRVLGGFLRDVMRLNDDHQNFRLFGPDETASNRLNHVFEATNRTWTEGVTPSDDHLAPDGRVMEVLSEHLCQGWLEGYLLTGRHGLFSCYEAFIHIIDSMFNQHAKWLKTTRQIPWRQPIASLNYLLTSHVWGQDHNGFSHQDPGFIDHVINKKAEVVRVYLPPDANTLLSVADHCLRSKNYVNVIVAGKKPSLQYLDMNAAIKHCTPGAGIWEWASNDETSEPDVVLACAGDVPTLEILAATDILRQEFPDLKIRVVNVVDLMKLQPESEHPHGLSDRDFDSIFTTDKPVIFAFHGYPTLIHRLTYRRTNHHNIHVRGYKEEGTTTTPFDMVVLNDLDRFHLVIAAIERVPQLEKTGARPAEFGSLKDATCHIDCPACGNDFDLHLDRDVRVTFSASDNLRRTRGDESVSLPVEASEHTATHGLDLLLAPMFRKLFSNEAPALNESLRIGRVAVLFTDLRGSTAIYAERGDPRAYRMVREHFDVLIRAVERNRGVLVKTIGDSVMATFASASDAVRSAFEAQAELGERVEQIGGELILKAGVHTGACLAVNLNDRLDFFGGAVNTAARVQGLSHGGDVVVTSEVLDELNSAVADAQIKLTESFHSQLRGLPAPIQVHRLTSSHQKSQVSAIPLIK